MNLLQFYQILSASSDAPRHDQELSKNMDLAELKGRAVVITGASRGIGESTARAFARAGCGVILAARSIERCEQIAQEIQAAGGRAHAIACDVSRYEQLSTAVALCQKSFGRFDIMINNAGVIDPITLTVDADPELWSQALDINLKGCFFGIHAALQVFRTQAHGIIINISSGAASYPLEGWSHYCAAKAGASMLTRTTHLEAAANGVRILGLSPGTVATEMQKKIKTSGINPVSLLEVSDHIPPEWPARAILWMCTDAAREFDGSEIRLSDPSIRERLELET